jgi:hypothetical protein
VTESTGIAVPRHRVRVWFGQTAISNLLVAPAAAERQAAAMRRRFASLRVTNQPVVKGQRRRRWFAGLSERLNRRFRRWWDEGHVADYTRPLLLGYVLRHLLMTDYELEDVKERLAYFAQVEGFAMGTIYVDETETSPAAFEALVEAVNRYEVTAVVIPSLLHFAALSAPVDMKDSFERATGARVMVAPPPT